MTLDRSTPIAARPALGAFLAGLGVIAGAGGLVWSHIESWDAAALALVGGGAAALAAAAALNARALFRTSHGRAAMNTGLAVVLSLTAFALASYINYGAVRGDLDLTRSRKFSLAPATRAALEGLTRQVEVTVVLTPEDLPEDSTRPSSIW
jgi:hypothetical protein